MDTDTLTINGVEYVRADSVQQAPKGDRAIVVIDRGWIYAGDVDETTKLGRLLLRRAVWLFRWEQIGLDGVIADPKSTKVTLKSVPGGMIDVPVSAEVYRIPVSEDWGL